MRAFLGDGIRVPLAPTGLAALSPLPCITAYARERSRRLSKVYLVTVWIVNYTMPGSSS